LCRCEISALRLSVSAQTLKYDQQY